MSKKKTGPKPKVTVSDVPRLILSWGDNPGLDPKMISAGANIKVNWICPECGCKWKASIHVRYYDNTDCPACSGKTATPENNALTKYPEISKLYDADFPGNPPLESLLPNSGKIVHWKCPECGEMWAQPLNQRIRRKNGKHYIAKCPVCSGKPIKGRFPALYPDIASEWDYEKNTDALGPDNVRPDSTANYWWKCSNDHFFCMSVADRVRYYEEEKEACPYCNNRAVWPGFNSFATNHPELLTEWEYVNNYALADPDKISDDDDTPVWWCCPDCGQRYTMSTRKRIELQERGRKSCPFCKGKPRKRIHFHKKK